LGRNKLSLLGGRAGAEIVSSVSWAPTDMLVRRRRRGQAQHNILDLVDLDGLGLLMSTMTARTRWTDALSQRTMM